jgi:uncharacterized protein (TIGR02284 family)
MSTNEHDVKVLNGLIETTIDSADGYAEAAKDSDSSRYVSSFQSRAAERHRVTTDLQQQVRTLGGKPDDSGTALASAHRVFVNLRKSMSKGDVAVVDEVERGEDHIKAKFEDALKDHEVSPPTRQVITHAYASVKNGHDQMCDLKHALHNPR